MAEVLVLVDQLDGEIKKATFELLTAARALGEPSAVVVGPAGTAGKLAESLKAHGAEKIYVAESDSTDFLTLSSTSCSTSCSGSLSATVQVKGSASDREACNHKTHAVQILFLLD